jgi:hypothetical protein
MLCDTGFGGRFEAELRLAGVHAPEIHPMQPGGRETADFVNAWFTAHAKVNRRWPFHVEVEMTTTFEPQMNTTFTRFVATVWDIDGTYGTALSLNCLVNTFLSGHPEWGGGA